PQFEAGPKGVGKGGVVSDPALHVEIRARVADFVRAAGWRVIGEGDSPILGGDGNREFLIAARKPG
ncbi:MAG: SAM-dependent methyltransferase, partial [Pseudomonadota bacterium]